MTSMQFGLFTVGDVTPDPTNGTIPDRARAHQEHDHDRQEGRGDRPRRVRDRRAPQPAVRALLADDTLAYIAAQTEKLILSTSTTLITTNDPVKIAEDYATLQHLADGRMDLMLGRGNTAPVYPWFGYDRARRSS